VFIFLVFPLYLVFFFYLIILLLYWGYTVIFTKVLTIYHSWIHLLHHYPSFSNFIKPRVWKDWSHSSSADFIGTLNLKAHSTLKAVGIFLLWLLGKNLSIRDLSTMSYLSLLFYYFVFFAFCSGIVLALCTHLSIATFILVIIFLLFKHALLFPDLLLFYSFNDLLNLSVDTNEKWCKRIEIGGDIVLCFRVFRDSAIMRIPLKTRLNT
jgi:hypothetical protein